MGALQPYSYGWRHELPAPYRFFGQPVTLTIETRPVPAEALAPVPSQTEISLVRLILSELPGVLAKAEQEFAAYNKDFPDVLGKVHDPRVWLCREFQETDGPECWALASGISDAPDWTICVEFRALRFQEVWSGD